MFLRIRFGLVLWILLATVLRMGGAELRAWPRYEVILWLGDSVAQAPAGYGKLVERMKEMGVTCGMVHHEADPRPFLEAKFPYYVENLINKGLCLKWNSNVRDWDAFVTQWARTGRPESAFVRDYGLDDPPWMDWAEQEAKRLGQRHAPHRPLAYNLRDELSVTISANPFDFDYAPSSLRAFRDWLRTIYPGLEALNAAWDTRFAQWEEVRPFSTDRIKQRMASGLADPSGAPDWPALAALRFDPDRAGRETARWNFAPWADFRTFMDLSLARALGKLRATLHSVDPATPVGIEGTQMPSAFGGYDLWRLAQVLDWVEPYDIGNAREIFGSFMPGRPILTTVFETETQRARRRLWHLLLEGDRGCIIWWSEDCLDPRRGDLPLTAKALALQPVLQEMNSQVARIVLRAQRERDPVYVHYSQPSLQVNWLLESTVDGSTWPRRFSSFEAEHNRMAKVRNAWVKGLQDLGLSPQFLASPALEAETSDALPVRALVLPQSSALSDLEWKALGRLRSTNSQGRQVPALLFLDGWTGRFDQHGRLRPRVPGGVPGPLPDLAATAAVRQGTNSHHADWLGDLAAWPAQRLRAKPEGGFWDWLGATGLRELAPVRVPPSERVRIHRLRLGPAWILGFERNIDYHMSEALKQAGGNEALEKRGEVTARLAEGGPAGHLYDLANRAYLGTVREWTFTLDPWRPSLFVQLPEHVDPERLWETLERYE